MIKMSKGPHIPVRINYTTYDHNRNSQSKGDNAALHRQWPCFTHLNSRSLIGIAKLEMIKSYFL